METLTKLVVPYPDSYLVVTVEVIPVRATMSLLGSKIGRTLSLKSIVAASLILQDFADLRY